MSREALACVASGAVSAGVAAPFVGVGWAVLIGLIAMLVVAWAIDVALGRR